MKTFILTLAVLTIFNSIEKSYSQPVPPVEWIKYYNGGQSRTMKIDLSGNAYISGEIYSNGYSDFCTIMYDAQGIQQWMAFYNGSENLDDEPASIDIDNQGNVYVTGTANKDFNNPVFTGDYCTVKYNSSGQQQWVKIYNGSSNGRDVPFKVAVDGSGNVYVTGQSYSGSVSDDNIVTIKYAPDGTQLWLAVHDGGGTFPAVDSGRDLILDAQANVYVFGHSSRVTTGYDLCLIKYNTSGVQQFNAYYTGPYNNITEYGVALTLDNSGNIYCVGELSSGNMAVLKYSPSGNQIWVHVFDMPFHGNAKDILVDAYGNVYFCGSVGTTGFVAKLNSSGSLLWNKVITGTGGNEMVHNIMSDDHGNVLFTGKIAAGTYFDFVTEKINPDGVTQWRATYNGSGNLSDYGNAIAMDGSGYVYVTGISNEGSIYGFCTIKYSQSSIGITNINTSNPQHFSLSQNYPNPFNPVTKINFSLPVKEKVSLKVFDILGKEITGLIHELELLPGTYSYDFNAAGLTSGAYFYTLETSSFRESRKMLLIK